MASLQTNIADQLNILKSLPISEHLKSGFTYSQQKPPPSERNRAVINTPNIKPDTTPVSIPSPTNKPLPLANFQKPFQHQNQIFQPSNQPPVITIEEDDELLSLDIAQHQQTKTNPSKYFNNNASVPQNNSSPYGNLSRPEIEAKIREIVDNLLSTQNELIALFQNPSEDSQLAEKKEQLRATKESLEAEKKLLDAQLKTAPSNSFSSGPNSFSNSTDYENGFSYNTNYSSSLSSSSSNYTSLYDQPFDSFSSYESSAPTRHQQQFKEVPRDTSQEQWSKEIFEWNSEVKAVLLSTYGYHNFRERQLEIINATLAKRDVFVLMPTGGGKSLCFQIPALVRKGVTVVICPLIALIQDQVESLKALGVEADYIGSGQSEQRESLIFRELYKERPTLKLLYVTPEKVVQSGRTMNTLTRLYNSGNLAHVVVDEAHCVSQWGHEFRKDYMMLHVFKESFPDVPIIALTATATSQVKKDVINKLRMHNPLIFQTSFNRPNLRYEIRKKSKSILSDMVNFIKEKYTNKCGIIYCLARKDCEKVAQKLRDEYKIKAEHYHAQVPNEERNRIQKRWLNDETKIIVATIAFGLGINKPDVRFVMHYSLPKSVEGYYQEAGRAGRDGGVSHCILYYSYADKFKVEFLIKNEENTTQEFKNHLIENLNTMVSYCENQVDCRRKLQLQYLGEDFDVALCRGTCDNCKNARPHVKKDVTESAKDMIDLLKEVSRSSTQITSNQLVQVFRGKKNQTMVSKGFTSLSKFDCGKQFNKVDAERILRYLVDKQIIKEVTESNGLGYPVTYISLNERAAINLKNSKERIVLQFTETKKSSTTTTTSTSTSRSRKKPASKGAPKDFILYGKLHALRTKIAQEANQEAFHVFNNATLEEMSSVKPSSLEDMSSISGVGKIKLKKFGAQFLEVVLQHLQNDTSRSQFFKGDNQAPKRNAPSYDQSLLEEDIAEEEEDEDDDEDYEDSYESQQYNTPLKNSALLQSTKRFKAD